MKHRYVAFFRVAIAFMIGGPIASGQAAGPPNPVPKAGIMIEPIQGKGAPESKITNRTAGDLGILYAKDKFVLGPGEARSIPLPQEEQFDLKIFEKRPKDGLLVPRFDGKSARNAKKRFIPLPWAKPIKQDVAPQAAP